MINYVNLTITIVDSGLENSNSSSLPFPSISEDDFYINSYPSPLQLNQPITMIDCPSRVISARYINITSLKSSSFSASIFGKYYVYSYTYIVVGSLRISEMKDNCRIREAAWVSIQSPFSNVLSNISSIRDALVYGFELPWSYFYCLKCSSHTDHHLWACRPYSDHVCDVAHQSSYHLSNCIGRNLHGIIQTLKDGQFEENIGKIQQITYLIILSKGSPYPFTITKTCIYTFGGWRCSRRSQIHVILIYYVFLRCLYLFFT